MLPKGTAGRKLLGALVRLSLGRPEAKVPRAKPGLSQWEGGLAGPDSSLGRSHVLPGSPTAPAEPAS